MRSLPYVLICHSVVPLWSGLAAADEARQEAVIVTAPGPARSADELVGNATAIGRDDLVKTLSGTLGDTLAREPAVATSFFGQGASRPVLRGLGAERVQVLTNGLGVIDASAASPDHQVAADGIDAEKIEILRGPAALAYGGQAIGGVINVIDGLVVDTLPSEAVSGDLFAASNSVNDGTEAAGRGQLVAGPFVFKLGGSERRFGDYDIPDAAESPQLQASEGPEAHEEAGQASGSLENTFLDTRTLSAGMSWVGQQAFLGAAVRQQAATYGLPGHDAHDDADAPEETSPAAPEEQPFIDLTQTRIDLRGGVSIDAGPLMDLTGALAIVDYDHTEFEAPGEAGTFYGSDGVEGRLELAHALGGFNGALGVQFLDKDLNATGEEAFLSSTASRSLAVFLYEARDWETGFGVEGGLRFEQVERRNIDFGEADFTLFSGSIGAHRHSGNGLFMGGQISYTERAPNENELFARGAHLATRQFETGNPGLTEERGLNLETALRWRGALGGLGLNLFMTRFDGFIYLQPDLTPAQPETDFPRVRVAQKDAVFTGGELYGDLAIDDALFGADWTVKASLDLVTAELKDGQPVPYLPPATLKVRADAAWSRWDIGATLIVAADQSRPGAGQRPTDGYTTLDLRAAHDLSGGGIGAEGTEVFLEARNLNNADQRYATSVLKDFVPGPGRNLRVGVRLTF